jgi:cellulose synthase/poly-beta-1,6-N-acetylglucosamine synthase-like glycosyltransferase
MELPLIILLLILYGYILIILLFFLEMDQEAEPDPGPQNFRSAVSIVVPFRNEQDQLPGLIEDLSGQTYPEELTEILFVDDHSMDDSPALLASLTAKKEHIHCLALPPGVTGKKKALALGIQHAKNERIIQVDADCRLDAGFVAAHMSFLEKDPADLVAGLVTTRKEKGNFLEIFDRLEILALMGSAAGSFNLKRPMMCSGANFSYSRELYWETRPFDPEDKLASGDDMFLMIGARKLGRRLAFITSSKSVVRTAPRRALGSMLVQRIRWASKAGKLKMPDIQLMALLVVLTNVSVFLMPLWFLLYPAWWPWIAGAWLLKTLADFLLLFKVSGICGSRSDLKVFLPVSFFYYPYFLAILLGAMWIRPSWKGKPR